MYENDGFHPYEDNNDAQNNYEAQSSETSGNQWQQPLYQMPQQPEHTQPKKKHTAGRVVALALCCSLLGGAVGAGAMAIGTSMTGTSGGSRSSSTSTAPPVGTRCPSSRAGSTRELFSTRQSPGRSSSAIS